METPIIGYFFADGRSDRHLRHHGCTTAPDQAAIRQQHIGARIMRGNRGRHSRRARADDQNAGLKMNTLR